jgi:hypothetical protein
MTPVGKHKVARCIKLSKEDDDSSLYPDEGCLSPWTCTLPAYNLVSRQTLAAANMSVEVSEWMECIDSSTSHQGSFLTDLQTASSYLNAQYF